MEINLLPDLFLSTKPFDCLFFVGQVVMKWNSIIGLMDGGHTGRWRLQLVLDNNLSSLHSMFITLIHVIRYGRERIFLTFWGQKGERPKSINGYVKVQISFQGLIFAIFSSSQNFSGNLYCFRIRKKSFSLILACTSPMLSLVFY